MSVSKKTITLLLFLSVLGLGGCGDEVVNPDSTSLGAGDSSSDGDGSSSGTSGGDASSSGSTTTAASLALLTSNPQLSSASSAEVTLTAIVKDSNNRLLSGVPVDFAADSGDLLVSSEQTNSSGVATATLSPGYDPTNRTITVTATADSFTATAAIAVSGTEISINGQNSLTVGDHATLTLSLTDSAGNGVPYQTVTIDGGANDVSPVPSSGSFQTDADGQLEIDLTAGATDTLTASALGASTSFDVAVSQDQFTLTAASSLDISTCQPITATWLTGSSDTPVVGESVSFSVTRGSLYSDAACTTSGYTAATGATGQAVVYAQSANPGSLKITAAAVNNGPSASATSEFVATDPAVLTLQADRTSLGPNESVTLTAVVRDGQNNLVKGIPVKFSITKDPTGGSLTPGQDTTDSLGRAQTVYSSSSATSPKDGVVIEATIPTDADPDPSTAVTAESAALTVAKAGMFVKVGLDSDLRDNDTAAYEQKGVVFVTDANGNAVADADVYLSVIPIYYYKGVRELEGLYWYARDGSGNLPKVCPNEDGITGDPDYDYNGILDIAAGEDVNGNGSMEPGNVVSLPDKVTTSADGYGEFSIFYPKDFGNWVYVRLTATAKVEGSEGTTSTDFELMVTALDIANEFGLVGRVSPFGQVQSCADPN